MFFKRFMKTRTLAEIYDRLKEENPEGKIVK